MSLYYHQEIGATGQNPKCTQSLDQYLESKIAQIESIRNLARDGHRTDAIQVAHLVEGSSYSSDGTLTHGLIVRYDDERPFVDPTDLIVKYARERFEEAYNEKTRKAQRAAAENRPSWAMSPQEYSQARLFNKGDVIQYLRLLDSRYLHACPPGTDLSDRYTARTWVQATLDKLVGEHKLRVTKSGEKWCYIPQPADPAGWAS